MQKTGRLATFGYVVLLRALAAMGGALTGYGATGMFTTGGITPPNALATVGFIFTLVVAAAMWSSERRTAGLWPALLLPAVAYSLYGLGGWAQAECVPPYALITPTHNCAPVGSHAVAVVAPILTLIALTVLVRDLRVLAGPPPHPSGKLR